MTCQFPEKNVQSICVSLFCFFFPLAPRYQLVEKSKQAQVSQKLKNDSYVWTDDDAELLLCQKPICVTCLQRYTVARVLKNILSGRYFKQLGFSGIICCSCVVQGPKTIEINMFFKIKTHMYMRGKDLKLLRCQQWCSTVRVCSCACAGLLRGPYSFND